MLRQLQNVALNVALGVVSERPYVKRVQNPYAHFGRPDLWTEGFRRNNQRFIHNHIYRICEVRPPSIEKVKYMSSLVCFPWIGLNLFRFKKDSAVQGPANYLDKQSYPFNVCLPLNPVCFP